MGRAKKQESDKANKVKLSKKISIGAMANWHDLNLRDILGPISNKD